MQPNFVAYVMYILCATYIYIYNIKCTHNIYTYIIYTIYILHSLIYKMAATKPDQEQLIAHDPIYNTKDKSSVLNINLSDTKYNCEKFGKIYDKNVQKELTDYTILSYDTKDAALTKPIDPTESTNIEYVCHPTGYKINVNVSKPYLLFYEFLLEGYTVDLNHTFKTGISNTDKKTCGLINVDGYDDELQFPPFGTTDSRRSCDSLSDGKIGDKLTSSDKVIFGEKELNDEELRDVQIINIIKNNYPLDDKNLKNEANIKNLMKRLYLVYRTSKTRTTDIKELHQQFYKSAKWNNIFKGYAIAIIAKFIRKIDECKNIYGIDEEHEYTKPHSEACDTIYTEDNGVSARVTKTCHNSYIQKYTFSQKDKVILLGDIHGSFHTFYRIILRFHRMGVLDINTLKFKDTSYKIIFLGDIVDRGQYSYLILSILFPLMYLNPDNVFIIRGNHEECSQNNRDGLNGELKTINDDDVSFNMINDVFLTFPSAILLKYKIGENVFTYWLAHGGFHVQSAHEPEYTIDDKLDEQIFALSDYGHGNDIRWTDFFYDETTVYKDARPKRQFNDATNVFRKIYNIDYIIRGHQDTDSSFMFMSRTSTDHLTRSTPFTQSIAKHKNIFHLADANSTYDGPISILEMDSELNKYMNVITVSTCTDIARYLNRDSFCILCSGSDVQNLPNLKQTDVSADLLTMNKSPEKGSHYKKYIKYKQKYLIAKNKLLSS